MECIYAHLENTVGHLNRKKPKPKPSNNINNQSNYNNNNNYNAINVGVNNMSINNDLPSIQNRILQVINVPEYANSEAGCNVAIIFKKLSNEDVNSIRAAIDALSDAGHIYSTVDEEHYKYCGDQN